jgi:hypothetical protein
MDTVGTPTPGRPVMPESYGLAASEKFKPITWEWVTQRLRTARNYWVATTRQDGRPHVSPVWGLWMDGLVMFSTDSGSAQARNAARNPACSVHLEGGDEVVIIDGALERVTDPLTLLRCNDEYDARYSINPGAGADGASVFALAHRPVLAWMEVDFPSTATRWHFY